uniref:MULE transposase domain-containing protein n=1 Tax=Nicotiana tabacum TaxID=4097 RepID=A0A1S3XG80_TOBAC|nr:PREDICTED: uncharacterized protein LOC107764859 [Nicotiana tabacum]
MCHRFCGIPSASAKPEDPPQILFCDGSATSAAPHLRNPNRCYALLCMSEDCEWRFKASRINKSELFKVREFIDKHTCPLKDKVYEQRQASSSLIGGMIRPKLTNHKRKYTPKDIIDDVKSYLGVDVSYMLAWRAKEKAMNFLRGEPTHCGCGWKSPKILLDRDIRLGQHVGWCSLRCVGKSVMAYGDLKSIRRWPGRFYVIPGRTDDIASDDVIIGIVPPGGARQAFACGHILPIAYGVIDSKNDAAWTWFFEQFKIAYGDRENMCIVSGRNESIIKSVSRVYPDVPHFACVWHLWNNVYKKFKKSHAKLSEIYFSMAKTYTQAEFDCLMEKVEKVDIRVKEYLELAGYEKWARLYAPVNRGWTMTSNIAE